VHGQVVAPVVGSVSGAPRSKPLLKQPQNGVPAPSAWQNALKQALSPVSALQVVAPAVPALALLSVQFVPPEPALVPAVPPEPLLPPQAFCAEQLAFVQAESIPSASTTKPANLIARDRSATFAQVHGF
jgi:hypothetical protein